MSLPADNSDNDTGKVGVTNEKYVHCLICLLALREPGRRGPGTRIRTRAEGALWPRGNPYGTRAHRSCISRWLHDAAAERHAAVEIVERQELALTLADLKASTAMVIRQRFDLKSFALGSFDHHAVTGPQQLQAELEREVELAPAAAAAAAVHVTPPNDLVHKTAPAAASEAAYTVADSSDERVVIPPRLLHSTLRALEKSQVPSSGAGRSSSCTGSHLPNRPPFGSTVSDHPDHRPTCARFPLSLEYAPLEWLSPTDEEKRHRPLSDEERKAFWAAYRFTREEASDASLAVQQRIRVLEAAFDRHPANVTTIAGNVTMIDVESSTAYSAADADAIRRVGWETGKRLGLDLESTHVMVAVKLLIVITGDGRQVIHFDIDYVTKGSYAMLINVCDDDVVSGINTTAMPRFSVPQEFAFVDPAAPTQAELRRLAFLFDPEWYHHVPFTQAQVLFFDQMVPHFGTQNKAPLPASADRQRDALRKMLFSLWVPKDSPAALQAAKAAAAAAAKLQRTRGRKSVAARRPAADDSQLFRWMYLDHAFTIEPTVTAAAVQASSRTRPNSKLKGLQPSRKQYSREYAEALVENANEFPIDRYVDQQAKDDAIECLRHFSYVGPLSRAAATAAESNQPTLLDVYRSITESNSTRQQ